MSHVKDVRGFVLHPRFIAWMVVIGAWTAVIIEAMKALPPEYQTQALGVGWIVGALHMGLAAAATNALLPEVGDD